MSKSIFDIFIDLYENNYIDGNYNIKSEYADLSVEYVKKTGNQTISSDTSWGNTTADSRNLFVCVDGNLTVNSGCTLTAAVRKRGMFIWVRGDLTLNGTISMTARGASAAGQRLLLCNIGSDYEVPATGGAGGNSTTKTWDGATSANNGTSGVATGACGGGGSGPALVSGAGTANGGAGAAGTSYSGGTGGGAGVARSCTANAGSGTANGGAGGNADACNGVDLNTMNAGGGAGNPGGAADYAGAINGTRNPGDNGTGGLLVLYVVGTLTFGASGTLSSIGSNGGNVTGNASNQAIGGGGGSGGGHIDYFYKTISGSPIINVAGGVGGTRSGTYLMALPGGNGGAGSTRATQVDLTYYTITASAGEGGSISPSGKSIVYANEDKTYTITPKPYYEIEDVLVDSVSVGAVSTYTFNSVSDNHTIQAIFSEKSTLDIVSIATPLSLKVTKEINGSWYANMTILPDDYIQTDSYIDINGEEYVVKRINKTKSDKTTFDVYLLHNAMEELAMQTIDRINVLQSAGEILSTILDGSGWEVGTCEITDIVAFKLDKRVSRLEALTTLVDKVRGEVDYHSKERTVDLKYRIGNETGLQLRYDKNCTEIQKEEDSTDIITRIYPYGSDNYPINCTILDDCEDETLYIPSSTGATFASDNKMFKSIGIEIVSTVLNETFIRDLGAGNVIDLSNHNSLKFWIYSEEDNANGFTFGIGESAYSEITVNTGALKAKNWHDITLDLSSVPNASKNAIRYIGFKNLTNGSVSAIFDFIRAFNGLQYIDSPNIDLYRVPKEYVYQHSAKLERQQVTIQIYPSDNTEVKQDFPNSNFSTSTYLESRDEPVASYDYMSFMKFALNQIPTGATVTSAKLNLYVYFLGVNNSNAGVTSNVHLASSNWSESTLTWNNKPSAGDLIGTINMTSIGWKTLDITSTLNSWRNGTIDNYGLRFFPTSAQADRNSAWYSSRSVTNKPYIEVTYTILDDPQEIIKAAAHEYLYNNDEPKLKYSVKMSDLSKVIEDTWEEEKINLGDTVKIYDGELNLNVNVRIKKITRDLLNPSNVDIELVNKSYNFINTQAEINQKLSYAMPFKDKPNVIDANAVQEGYLGGSVNV